MSREFVTEAKTESLVKPWIRFCSIVLVLDSTSAVGSESIIERVERESVVEP